MSDNLSKHYFLKIWLKSMDEPLVLPVAEAAWGRFQRAFDAKRDGFFICATRDGRTLALNHKYIELAHVLSEVPEEPLIDSYDSLQVTLHYPNLPGHLFEAGDPKDLARIFSSLKRSVGGETLTFTDSDGHLVMFFSGDLLFIETATAYVEEGYKWIYYEERGTFPPS